MKNLSPDDSNDRMSSKVLSGLENVDDDLGRKEILIVKMDKDRNDVSNVDEFPAVVFYDEKIPTVFQGKFWPADGAALESAQLLFEFKWIVLPSIKQIVCLIF